MRFRSVLITLCAVCAIAPAQARQATSPFATPLDAANLDAKAFGQWVGGSETPLTVNDGPTHVIWTRTTLPTWDGARFGESKTAGVRHMRIGWKQPLALGAVVMRGGGSVSALKPSAPYPGNLADDSQWIPATQLRGRDVTRAEAGQDDYAVWVLPTTTSTRALRFTHTAQPTDRDYNGWLGGVYLLTGRYANVAMQASSTASANDEKANKVANGTNDGTWSAWDNGADGGSHVISPSAPETVVLTWPQPVKLSGLCALWAGFGAAEAQVYTGPASRHPREAPDSDWQTVATSDTVNNLYTCTLGANWFDFGKTVHTRAVRLRITKVTAESHPHLNGATKGGKRVWLGELLALSPLGTGNVQTAVLPTAPAAAAPHPPIPVRFTLKEGGWVTLVIEDAATGKRVRNLISEVKYPAGTHAVWWDGANDLRRDPEAVRHGIYTIPTELVKPGAYRVRGLVRKDVRLRYEFSVYNAGNPAWETVDNTGGWLTNHTPPQAAAFLPAQWAPTGKDTVYLGSYVAEGGHGLAWVDLTGKKISGRGWVGGAWTAAPFVAVDSGKLRDPDTYVYVGASWSSDEDPNHAVRKTGDIRLTALTKSGDKSVIKYTFLPPTEVERAPAGQSPWTAQLAGMAVRDNLLALAMNKLNKLVFVDATLGRVRAEAPVLDPRGLAFDAEGRLLVLSGSRLLRYTLPYALAPGDVLAPTDWTATASANNDNAAYAIRPQPGKRWSTNAWQQPGQTYTLDMRQPRAFSAITLYSESANDTPHGYSVCTSNDGATWSSPIAQGKGTASLTVIEFARTTARYIRIEQTDTTNDCYWSINKMSVLDIAPAASGMTELPKPEEVVASGLESPQGITLDAQGNIYISDRGASHQVKVFTTDGKLVRAIGHAGVPKAGPYDPLHMNNPRGMAVDSQNHLWVTEEDYTPKRVSVWTLDGKLLKAMYGPGQYGGGGTLDPRDKTRFYYTGLEFKLDWQKGVDTPKNVIYRPQPGELRTPDGYGCDGLPERPIYANGRQYMTNSFNNNPTAGAPVGMLWLMRDGIARPVAALGSANDWSILKAEAFKPKWPVGIDLNGDMWKNRAMFCWSDLNGNGQVEPEEVQFAKCNVGGITAMEDLAIVAARVDGKAMRYAVKRYTPGGAPVYDITCGTVVVNGAQDPTSSGGDQALVNPNGWSVLTVAPAPFAPQSLGGSYKGTAMWSYPSLWPGLHASHEAPPPDRPGEVIGSTRLLGGFVTPRGGQAGPLWCINGNMGNMYLFTYDGLFVSELFRDIRVGTPWNMPVAQRNMVLDNVSLHDENFWPTITQTPDGAIYLVDGGRTSLVRIDGLDSIRRIAPTSLRITAADLKRAHDFNVQVEVERQRARGGGSLTVAAMAQAPSVDGKLDEWKDAQWASIDKRGTGAFFDSSMKPYDVSAAVAISGDRLYAAFRTGAPNLLRNSGESVNAPFKCGGALDIMIGVNPAANPKRTAPVEGDERLLITRVKDRTYALLYRAVVPGATNPVPFSSPWRTIKIDSVEDVSAHVELAGVDGAYEISIPLEVLGLNVKPAMSIRGDIGILRGDGRQTIQRVYWSNKATAITADVPSEAELTPLLWGEWRFP